MAPEHFQTQQGFLTCLTAELSRPLEAALVLPTSGFHRAAANGFAASLSSLIIHPVLMLVKIMDFLLHRLGDRAARPLRPRLLQLADDFEGGLVFQLLNQRLEPGF